MIAVKDTSTLVNTIIVGAGRESIPVRPMKLQKLLYFFQGWYHNRYGGWLLTEDFEAWPYGPVIPSVYDEYKELGEEIIYGLSKTRDGEEYVYSGDNKKIGDILQDIVEIYAPCTDLSLSDFSHKKGGAWDKTQQHGWGKTIDKEDIENEFKERILR